MKPNFGKHISDKRLKSKSHKELTYSISEKINGVIQFKMREDQNGHFSKNTYKWPTSRVSPHLMSIGSQNRNRKT